jgi:DNA-binding response OmpR family regulator
MTSELQHLRDDNDRLRSEVRRLREILASGAPIDIGIDLPRRERCILAFLLRKAPHRVSKEQIFVACFENHESIDIRTIESHVSKLNKKLRTLSIHIEGKRFDGYSISAADATRLRATIAERGAALAGTDGGKH